MLNFHNIIKSKRPEQVGDGQLTEFLVIWGVRELNQPDSPPTHRVISKILIKSKKASHFSDTDESLWLSSYRIFFQLINIANKKYARNRNFDQPAYSG